MKKRVYMLLGLLAVLTLFLSGQSSAQSGEATITLNEVGGKLEAGVFLRRTGGTAWNLGFATFAFKFNKTTLAFEALTTAGQWDGATSGSYGALVSASSLDSTVRSLDVELTGAAGTGTEVPTTATLIGVLRFVIKNQTQAYDVKWDTAFTTVYTDQGAELTSNIGFTDPTGLGAVEDKPLPVEFSLSQNYPNPFNPSTMIEYALPRESKVTLEVYNTLGERVATLVDGVRSAGYHHATFDAARFSSGIYFYRLSIENNQKMFVRKMMLLK